MTPSSLTDRVRAMKLNPRVPIEQSIAGQQTAVNLLPQEIETVPTAFKWAHGGNQVFVAGSFNHWQGKIAMHRGEENPNEFALIIDIPPGIHQYKYMHLSIPS